MDEEKKALSIQQGEETEEQLSEQNPLTQEEEATVQEEKGEKEHFAEADSPVTPPETLQEGAAISQTDTTQKTENKKMKHEFSLVEIVLGLIVLFSLIAVAAKAISGNTGYEQRASFPVVYAKDNALYVMQPDQQPQQLTDQISNGGNYHYYYSAWGTAFSEAGDQLYYGVGLSEAGLMDLYSVDLEDAEAGGTLLAEQVFDYTLSNDGSVVAYLTEGENGYDLSVYNGVAVAQVAEGLELVEGCYTLSPDGNYVVYQLPQTDGSNSLCVYGIHDGQETVLTEEALETYTMAEESNTVYYVLQQSDGYALYEYAYGNKPTMVAEGITYLEILPNGKDVLYCKTGEEKIPYSQILLDDVAQSDADLSANEEGYEQKQQRDKLRELMEEGEGMDPILQECYLWSAGEAVLLAKDVLSATGADSEQPYVVCYTLNTAEAEQVPLSQVTNEEEIVYYYYMQLAQSAKPQVLLADATGNTVLLEGENVSATGVILCDNASKVAYFDVSLTDGTKTLMCADLTSSGLQNVVGVAENVETAAFLGHGKTLAYYYDYVSGIGALGVYQGRDAQLISENASGVYFAEDMEALYYIENADETTGNGDLLCFRNGKATVLDSNVFCLQYKNNGTLAYLKGYDYITGLGDLSYYNGKEAVAVDSGVTALFLD